MEVENLPQAVALARSYMDHSPVVQQSIGKRLLPTCEAFSPNIANFHRKTMVQVATTLLLSA